MGGVVLQLKQKSQKLFTEVGVGRAILQLKQLRWWGGGGGGGGGGGVIRLKD